MLADRISEAQRISGLKLKPLAAKSGVNYNTLFQQMSRGSAIPFETIDAISYETGLPLEFFSPRDRSLNSSLHMAREIARSAKAILDSGDTRAVGPDVGDFWRKLHEVDFQLDELGEIGAHVDIYDPVDATTELPVPMAFGRKGLARLELGFQTPEDYFRAVAGFDKDLRRRSLECHIKANETDFQVSPEIIHETIDGQTKAGCFLRATARGIDRTGNEKTAILTQFVTEFPA